MDKKQTELDKMVLAGATRACKKCDSVELSFTPGRYGHRVTCVQCGYRGPDRVHKEVAVKAWNEGRTS